MRVLFTYAKMTKEVHTVCIEPVLCFLVEAVIGERIGDAGRVGIGEGEVGRLCEALDSPKQITKRQANQAQTNIL